MNRLTQQKILLHELRKQEWTPLPHILDLRIAKYSSRITELRKKGYVIENKKMNEYGIIRSWYRLVSEPKHEDQSTSVT